MRVGSRKDEETGTRGSGKLGGSNVGHLALQLVAMLCRMQADSPRQEGRGR